MPASVAEVWPPPAYGAVYYRASNPPREDWERDHATAAEDGFTAFRHWVLWSAVERMPGRFDWDDYDAQLELAAKHGMKTVLAEQLGSAPEWAFRVFADARQERRDGSAVGSTMSGSTATAGFPGLCLDHPDARRAAGGFLLAMAERYARHPGLGGYDVWNETSNYTAETCFCAATAERFREWLGAKYGDLETLSLAWRRYGFVQWDEVLPPRGTGAYPEVLDWLRFRQDNAQRLLAWRVGIIRAADPEHPITAHGLATTLRDGAAEGADDWRSAGAVDGFGFTWVAARHDASAWRHYLAADLTRGAAGGKTFWHSEAQGGPLWLQPQLPGRPRDDGRNPSGAELRLWLAQSLASGARGVFYPRWRPLLDGPLFGAFAPYSLGGERTDRSREAASFISALASDELGGLWDARPVRGELGIVYALESQLFDYAQRGSDGDYADAAEAAYRGFFSAGIQADWVRLPELDGYELLYLPYAPCLSDASIAALADWVEAGGVLVAEGGAGYFDETGRARTVQPGGSALAGVFGVREADVEFAPDLWREYAFHGDALSGQGAILRQALVTRSNRAEPLASFPDGSVAAVRHRHGSGQAILFGTSPSLGSALRGDLEAGDASFFSSLFLLLGRTPRITTSHPKITSRLHEGRSGEFLWLTNPTESDIRLTLTLADHDDAKDGVRVLWGSADREVPMRSGAIECEVQSRNALVLHLPHIAPRS